MALAATGVVTWNPSGSNDNAGYYDASLAGAGTDYSTATTAALTLTDLACNTGGTTLTSATGGFTAAMIGNGLYIKSGTHFTAGLYVITARADTNTVTLDRDPTDGTNATGGTGSVGGARAVWTDAFLEYSVAGMAHHPWATGTMTLTEALSIGADGTATLPIKVLGRASDGSANPTGDNRPLIAAGANAVFDTAADYWVLRDVRVTTTSANGLSTGNYGVSERCKCYNSSTTASRYAIGPNGASSAVSCEGQSDYGMGVGQGGGAGTFWGCYAHDCNQGAGNRRGLYLYQRAVATYCIADNCTTGFDFSTGDSNRVQNCVAYYCTTGVVGATSKGSAVVNCIFAECTTGTSWTTQTDSNWVDYNDYAECSTPRTNVAVGANDTTDLAGFVDAANGDFSLAAGSANLDSGLGLTLGVGA